MNTVLYPTQDTWPELMKRPTLSMDSHAVLVKKVFDEVKIDGDKAIKKFTKEFDDVDVLDLVVPAMAFVGTQKQVSKALSKAIHIAKKNIETFHVSQVEATHKVETMKGVCCWRESRAMNRVGLYIPGGSAPLFSTILMLAIPAQIAGCKEIIMCTPPNSEGKIDPVILFTAGLVGISTIYLVGGIQAIAGMTFGTESIPKVDKIFGPGNQYVTAAKMEAMKYVPIDMPAGPSEVLIIADSSAVPSFVAADLLAQAEHGADSQVTLLSTDKKLIEKVGIEIAKQIEAMPRKEIIKKALTNSKCILFKDLQTCLTYSNGYAPEHLILATEHTEELIEDIQNAGSVFLGNYTPESAGDYASGTNHTLPTNGYAKSYSGVSVDSFVKKITFQQINETGLKNIGSTVELMAEAESLIAHKEAVSIRLKQLK